MGLFSSIIDTENCAHDFNWILEFANNFPEKTKIEQIIENLNVAIAKANEINERINSITESALKTAGENLREELADVYSQLVTATVQLGSAKRYLETVTDDHVNSVINSAIPQITPYVNSAKEYSESAKKSVEDARKIVSNAGEDVKEELREFVKSETNSAIESAKLAIVGDVEQTKTEALSEIALAKGDLESELRTQKSELKTEINNVLLESVNKVGQENNSAVEEVKSFIQTNPFYKRGVVILRSSNWSGRRQAVTIEGIDADSDIIVTHTPGYYSAYVSNGVRLEEQFIDGLRFYCETEPAEDISVNIMIMLRGAEL